MFPRLSSMRIRQLWWLRGLVSLPVVDADQAVVVVEGGLLPRLSSVRIWQSWWLRVACSPPVVDADLAVVVVEGGLLPLPVVDADQAVVGAEGGCCAVSLSWLLPSDLGARREPV